MEKEITYSLTPEYRDDPKKLELALSLYFSEMQVKNLVKYVSACKEKPKEVNAKKWQCFTTTLLQIFGVGPKVEFICGHCNKVTSGRVPAEAQGNIKLLCLHCNVINAFPFSWRQ